MWRSIGGGTCLANGGALIAGRAFRHSPMSQCFRVLLVEDDDSLRACLGEFLDGLGWTVGATAHATEALTLARRQRFDFTLLDFHLPGMTGLELFQQLAAVQPLPAILMSGLASLEEIAAAQHAGFFTFLRKPLELERLRHSIERLIQTHFGGPLVRHSPTATRSPAAKVSAAKISAPKVSGGLQPPPPPPQRPPQPPGR